jgi:hypothetical protein
VLIQIDDGNDEADCLSDDRGKCRPESQSSQNTAGRVGL